MKVVKFGGSSVANTSQYKKIKDIISSDKERQIVVVSAPGKDEKFTSKITDLLFLLHAHVEYGIEYETTLETIYKRFNTMAEKINQTEMFRNHFETFKNELKKGISKDYLVSRGEYFSALLISAYLGYTFVDAKEIIFVNHDGTVNYEKTEKALSTILANTKNIVVPGFYAATPNKQVRLFGRGGSDLTGSILSKVLNADVYENWTDVDGIYVADPTIIKNPNQIKTITFHELRELSYRGAKVLQQEAVIPLEKTNIPILIKNTNNKDAVGTLISKDVPMNDSVITGISGLKNFTAINITKDANKSVTMVLKDVFDLFIKYRINVEHIPTGIDTFSIITKTDSLKNIYFDFLNDIREVDGVVSIEEEDEISLLAIVGRNMAYIPGVAGRLFSALGKNQINVKVIAQASKEICIIIGVDDKDYDIAIKTIYKEFYT